MCRWGCDWRSNCFSKSRISRLLYCCKFATRQNSCRCSSSWILMKGVTKKCQTFSMESSAFRQDRPFYAVIRSLKARWLSHFCWEFTQLLGSHFLGHAVSGPKPSLSEVFLRWQVCRSINFEVYHEEMLALSLNISVWAATIWSHLYRKFLQSTPF